jgi:hypothetical protein
VVAPAAVTVSGIYVSEPFLRLPAILEGEVGGFGLPADIWSLGCAASARFDAPLALVALPTTASAAMLLNVKLPVAMVLPNPCVLEDVAL